MRLTFSILWFDDTADFFDSLDIDWLKSQIVEWGFSPDIKLVTTSKEFTSYDPYKRIDLIVVDRNLEEYGEGQDFIAKIREHAVYTEVIFYTAGEASSLWDAIREKKLEGVFVSNRGTILEKISKVGHQSIRKVLDLENMRGIVMAEVGELDYYLEEILKVGISKLSGETQKIIFEKFHKEADKQNREFSDRLAEFSKTPELVTMLHLCDSNKRWENFNRLWKYDNSLKDRDRIGDYKAEVLDLRNILAHGIPEIREEGHLFRHHGKEFLFNDETNNSLRKAILKYKREFSSILDIVKQ